MQIEKIWVVINVNDSHWNYILWNLIMEYYIHYALSCQIIKHQEFFLFWNFSLIKRTCTFSLSIPFYSVLLGNSGILRKMLVAIEEVTLLTLTLTGGKVFHFFYSPCPTLPSHPPLAPARMTIAPNIYMHIISA